MKHASIISFFFFLITCIAEGQSSLKPLSQLIVKESLTWDKIKYQIQHAENSVLILPKNSESADSVLFQAQVTTKSPLGAIIYESGGIIIDSGWIRILGSGNKYLTRNLMSWNKGKSYHKLGEHLPFLLIADDVLGGFFAINGGGIDTIGIGNVYYFAPDELKWSNLELSYSGFLNFCFSGNLEKYYKPFRWSSWAKDISKLNGDSGFSFFPFLWSKEGKKNINKIEKKTVPIEELWDIYFKE